MYDDASHRAGCRGGSQILTCSSESSVIFVGAKCGLVTGGACVRAGGIIYLLIGGIEATAQGREIRCPQGMASQFTGQPFNKSLKLSHLVRQQMSGHPFLNTARLHPFAMNLYRTDAKAISICYMRMKGRIAPEGLGFTARLHGFVLVNINRTGGGGG